MGSTESKTAITQVNDTLVVNQNTFNSRTEQLNKQVSDTTVSDAKSCSAAVNNNQVITVEGLTVKGDLNLSTKQKTAAALSFSCVQTTDVRQKAGSAMIANLQDDIANAADTAIIQKLDAKAASAAEQQFGGIGAANSDSKISTTNISKSINTSNTNISKLIQNVVENKFKSDTISNCIAELKQNQEVSAKNITVGGQATIVFEQDAAAEAVTNCIQNSGVGSDILSTVAAELGVKISNENKTSTTQESKAAAESTAKNKGIMEGAGSAFESIGKAYSGVITSILGEGGIGGMMSSPGGMIFSIVSCIILVIGAIIAVQMYL
jgi:hypothetical protein